MPPTCRAQNDWDNGPPGSSNESKSEKADDVPRILNTKSYSPRRTSQYLRETSKRNQASVDNTKQKDNRQGETKADPAKNGTEVRMEDESGGKDAQDEEMEADTDE
ncbi:hypothetical protein PRNP1_009844 [Phytophthora ramorum]